MDVVILGAGGHGRDVAAIATDCGRFTSFRDDRKPGFLMCAPPFDGEYVIGVWEPTIRRKLDWPDHPAATLIHPAARIGRDCVIGEGSVIGPGAQLTNDVILGRHVHVGAGAILTRCTVGDHSTVSNGAIVLGDVTIGSDTLIGGGAVIRNLLTIGDHAVVGAGATVIRNVPADVAVAGCPAKPLGRLE